MARPGPERKGSCRGFKGGSDSLAQGVGGKVFHWSENTNEQVIPSTSNVEHLARGSEFTPTEGGKNTVRCDVWPLVTYKSVFH